MEPGLIADGVISIDDRPAIAAINRVNTGLDEHDKKVKTILDRQGRQWQVYGDSIVRVSDKGRGALDNLLRSMERQAALAGKSGTDKLIAERDILIKKWGQEDQAVRSITASYEKLIAAEKAAAEAKSAASNPFNSVQGAAGFAQSAISSPGSAIQSLTTLAGPVGTSIAGIAAALGSVEAAGLGATRSLAEYGIQVRDVELRTGLTSKEVGQFGFAAKAAGSDVSVFERGMRGLTAALEDNSSAGDKARQALKGVSLRNDAGELRSTSDIFLAIAGHLNGITDTFKRNEEGMAIFKKGWLELSPVLADLAENYKRAREVGFGVSEEEITSLVNYNKQLAEADTLWNGVSRKLKEGIAGTLWIDVKTTGATWILQLLGDRDGASSSTSRYAQPGQSFSNGAYGQLSRGDAANFAALDPSIEAVLRNPARFPGVPAGAIPTEAQRKAAAGGLNRYLENSGGLEGAQNKLSQLKQQYDQARTDAEKKASQSETLLPDIAKRQREAVDKARTDYERQNETVKSLAKEESQRLAQAEKIKDLRAKGDSFYIVGSGRDQTIVQETDIAARNAPRGVPSFFGRDRQQSLNPEQQIGITQALSDRTYKEGLQVTGLNDVSFVSPESSRTFQPGAESKAILDARQKGFGEQEKQLEQIRLAGITAESNATIKLLELRGGQVGEVNTARLVADLRQRTLNEEFSITGDIVKLRTGSLQNEIEMRLRIVEIEQKQFNEVKQHGESLTHTLFTNPRGFGKQLGTTVRDASLKPVEGAVGNAAAQFLTPLIFGARTGGGGDPLKLATDLNSQITAQNTAAIQGLTSAMSRGIGGVGSGFAIPSGGGSGSPASFGSGGGISYGPSVFGSDGGFAAPIGSSGAANIAGIPSFNGSPVFGGGGSGGGGGLAGLLGGGRGGGGGGFSLASLRGSFNKDNWFNKDVYESVSDKFSKAGTQSGALQGNIAGVLTSKGAGQVELAAGVPLAIAGLSGGRRGTLGGFAESVGGGALVGAGIGTEILPGIGTAIGAGIGAAAGALASGFEKLAGVESPENEAKRLVKSTYGLSIDTKMAQQIVALSQSKYSGHVSIAVRDPDIRKMLELYATGTGQRFPQSAATPRAGSLVEQGGVLAQQASYQYGQAYSFQSSLPVAGGFATSQYPSPTSLVLDGPATTALLSGQIANTVNPGYVQSQYSTALSSSDGRLSNSAALQQPGLVTF